MVAAVPGVIDLRRDVNAVERHGDHGVAGDHELLGLFLVARELELERDRLIGDRKRDPRRSLAERCLVGADDLGALRDAVDDDYCHRRGRGAARGTRTRTRYRTRHPTPTRTPYPT